VSDADDRAAWIAAFQENQRQLVKAHDEFQRTLAEGHKHFLDAMAQSQRRLARAIAGDDAGPDFDLPVRASLPLASTRKAPAIVDARRSGELWPVLRKDRSIGVVADEFGVAAHVVNELKALGWLARLLEPGQSADVLVFLGALLADERAMAHGRGLKLAAAWLKHDFSAIILVGDLGGRFGFDQLESSRAVHIGLLDLAIQSTQPARFIDLDVGFRRPEDAARDLVAEILGGGAESPVGLPEDGRVHLVEADAKVERISRNHDDDILLIVGANPPNLAKIRELWSGKVAGVGFDAKDADFTKSCDLFDAMSVYEAVDDVRLRCGPFTHLLMCEPRRDWSPDRAFHALAPFHALIASTAADPIRGIMASVVREDPAASLISWVFMAEQERRGHEAKMTVVICADADAALVDLFQGSSESTMWSLD
jgi:hypothetical protein